MVNINIKLKKKIPNLNTLDVSKKKITRYYLMINYLLYLKLTLL